MVSRPNFVSRRQLAALVVGALLVSAGTAAAVTVLPRDPNPITAAEGTLAESPVTVDSQSLTYTGTSVTGVGVVVNNTDTVEHTVDLHFSLRKEDGTLVEQTTKDGTTLVAGSTKTVTWTFSSEHPVDTFSQVEVTVEQVG